MNSLPSYPSDVKAEPFVARLLSLRGDDVPPVESTPFEIGTVNGAPVRVGFRIPEPPAPPAGGRVTGYELQPIGNRVPWMQEHDTPAGVVQYLLTVTLATYEVHALAAGQDDDHYRASWDFAGRSWRPWELT